MNTKIFNHSSIKSFFNLFCLLSLTSYAINAASKESFDSDVVTPGLKLSAKAILLSPPIAGSEKISLLVTMPSTEITIRYFGLNISSILSSKDTRKWIIEYLPASGLLDYFQIFSQGGIESLPEVSQRFDEISMNIKPPRGRRGSGSGILSPSRLGHLRSHSTREGNLHFLSLNHIGQRIMRQMFINKHPDKTKELEIRFLANTLVYKQINPIINFTGGWAILARFRYDSASFARFLPAAEPVVSSIKFSPGKTPGTKTPGIKTPGIKTSSTEAPSTEAPSTKTSSTETSSTEAPSTETPSTKTPVTQVRHVKPERGAMTLALRDALVLPKVELEYEQDTQYTHEDKDGKVSIEGLKHGEDTAHVD